MARKRRNKRSKRHSKHEYNEYSSNKPNLGSPTHQQCVTHQDSSTFTTKYIFKDASVQTDHLSALASIKFKKCPAIIMTQPTCSNKIPAVQDAACRELFPITIVSPNPFDDRPQSVTSIWLSIHGSSNAIKHFGNDSQESLLSMQRSMRLMISSEKRAVKASQQTLVLWKSGSKISSVGKPRKFFRQTMTNRLVKEKVRRKKAQRKKTLSGLNEVPKSFSPKQITMEKSANPLGISSASNGSSGGTFLQRIRVMHERYSLKLLQRFIGLCTWFGLTIKMGLVKACSQHSLKIVQDFRKPQTNSKSTEIISKPTSKLTLRSVRSECPACICFKKKVANLEQQMEAITKDFEEFRKETCNVEELRQEVADVKVLLKSLTSNGCRKVCTAPAPPPPPPSPMPMASPPPPPPLPLPIGPPKLCKLDIPRRQAKPKTHDDNVRPIISIDDILKVKLKKAGDRPSSKPASSSKLSNSNMKNTQPMVSMDMLKQVKLKPASRSQAGGTGCATAGVAMVKRGCLITEKPAGNTLAHVLTHKSEHKSSRLGA